MSDKELEDKPKKSLALCPDWYIVLSGIAFGLSFGWVIQLLLQGGG